MITDWLLIRRLARELAARFRGARVRDVGALPDGRLALVLWSRGTTHLVCIDPFASPPLVTVEEGELPIAAEAGFVRAVGSALRGTVVSGVQSRTGDRVLQIDCSVRSRFGVVADTSLILELVPRFGNAVLVKNGLVVAALREFSLADNGTRSVLAGFTYEPPPLDARHDVPKLIAQNYAADEAREIVARFGATDGPLEDLFVYRRDGALVQAHVVALPSFSDATLTREPSLLDRLLENRQDGIARGVHEGAQRRRATLLRSLTDRERKLRGEVASLDAQRARIAERDQLRQRGEDIYARLYEIHGPQRDEAKDEAAKLFAKYKKLGASLPHVEEREQHVRSMLEAVTDLQWEAERADEAGLLDVADALADLSPHRENANVKRLKRKKRALLEYRAPSGSRILVGRTPLENAELTFRVARSHDLWFHVQGQPGAHVILQRDDRAEPPGEDLDFAAAVAAAHSKARTSAKVPVDYTQRKYVRKRPNGAPGLVFYTDFGTRIVTPHVES